MSIFKRVAKKIETLKLRLMSHSLDNQMWSQKFHALVKKIKDIEVGIGSYGYLNMPGGTKIGNYCSIANGVKYLPGNHPVERVSTAACFYNPILEIVDKKYDIARTRLEVGNDVWIGANVLITNKVTHIPNGVVIGAGSVVTRTPPPYTIVAGNPAKPLRKRFDDETIKFLEKSEWWEQEPEIIVRYIDLFNQPKDFAKKIIEWKEKQQNRTAY